MPGYCGQEKLGKNVWVCSDGSAPTKLPNGKGGTLTQQSAEGADTVTGSALWNQDDSPVSYGWNRDYLSDSNTGETFHRTNDVYMVYEVQDDFDKIYGAAMSSNATKADKDRLRLLTSQLRAYTDQDLGTRGALEDAWNTLVSDAASSGQNVYELLGQSGSSFLESGSGGSSGGSGYSGPVSTVTNLNDADLRLMADTVSSTVLGRGVTDDEYKMIRSQVRSAESANPSVSGGVRSASMTSVSGLSGEARQDVITRALLQQDGAKEFTMATKMMGALDDFLRERPDV